MAAKQRRASPSGSRRAFSVRLEPQTWKKLNAYCAAQSIRTGKRVTYNAVINALIRSLRSDGTVHSGVLDRALPLEE